MAPKPRPVLPVTGESGGYISVLFPDAPLPEWKEILFVRKTDEHIRTWEGNKLTKEDAQLVSNIHEVRWSDTFSASLSQLMYQAENVYLNMNENNRSGDTTESGEFKFATKLERIAIHCTTISDSAPIMSGLRSVKSTHEIELLRKAIDITEKGFCRLLKFVKPGVWEYRSEAELSHEYLRHRCHRPCL
jgi:Xaa-Pro aminopeptidase